MSERNFYIDNILVKNGEFTLSEEESRHLVKVLRYTAGDEIRLLDGRGNLGYGVIIDAHPKNCRVLIMECIHEFGRRDYYVHLAVSPLKNMSRYEWFVEKAVEIGVDEITPLVCHYSEKMKINTDRLDKIAISAMKQSLKANKPIIHKEIPFNEIVKISFEGRKFIAYCGVEDVYHLKNCYHRSEDVLILIGPEGDFTVDEINEAKTNGFMPVSLGYSVLRTETAAMVSCNIINLINE